MKRASETRAVLKLVTEGVYDGAFFALGKMLVDGPPRALLDQPGWFSTGPSRAMTKGEIVAAFAAGGRGADS